jgi:hypothetical protein
MTRAQAKGKKAAAKAGRTTTMAPLQKRTITEALATLPEGWSAKVDDTNEFGTQAQHDSRHLSEEETWKTSTWKAAEPVQASGQNTEKAAQQSNRLSPSVREMILVEGYRAKITSHRPPRRQRGTSSAVRLRSALVPEL